MSELGSLRVEVSLREKYRQSGSCALEYEELHVQNIVLHGAKMMSRFCEWYARSVDALSHREIDLEMESK